MNITVTTKNLLVLEKTENCELFLISTNKSKEKSQPNDQDIIWGSEKISEVIGKTKRATFHMLAKGIIPAQKVGGLWVASRKKLKEYLVGAI